MCECAATGPPWPSFRMTGVMLLMNFDYYNTRVDDPFNFEPALNIKVQPVDLDDSGWVDVKQPVRYTRCILIGSWVFWKSMLCLASTFSLQILLSLGGAAAVTSVWNRLSVTIQSATTGRSK